MISFPLYDTLVKELDEVLEPLTKSEKDCIITAIKNLDSNGQELLYVLIKVHHLKENEQDYKLPYGMKSLKLGIRGDVNQLPLRLQHIINRFIILHDSSSNI